MSLATRKKVETQRLIRRLATAVGAKVKVGTVSRSGIEKLLDRELEKNFVGILLDGALTSVEKDGRGAGECEEEK